MNKIVLITGASSGFGKLTSEYLASKGHKVYASMREINGKNKDNANELSSINNIKTIELDVTKTDSVNNAVREIISNEGRIDVLVNNAGRISFGITESFTEDDFENILDINLKGPWRTLRATLPQFRKQREGLIINISSCLGRFSSPFMTIYNSAKFGLEGLIEGSHYELKGLGIDNVIIEPGAFPTELSTNSLIGSDQSVSADYGEIVEIPKKMGENLEHLFKSKNAPKPILIAEAISNLIDLPKGNRPLRTVVDPLTGEFTRAANIAVYEQYKKFLSSFGMGKLVE